MIIFKDLHRKYEEEINRIPSKQFFELVRNNLGLVFSYEDYSNPTITFTSHWYKTYFLPWIEEEKTRKHGNT